MSEKNDGGPDLRDDFDQIPEGSRVILYPEDSNPLHRSPVSAVYSAGYFYCDGSDPMDGPDYYFGDVARFCRGWSLLSAREATE